MTVEEVHKEVEATLNDLRPLFVKEMQLTFIARFPKNDEADMVISNDDPQELRKLIDRTIEREGQ